VPTGTPARQILVIASELSPHERMNSRNKSLRTLRKNGGNLFPTT
jgi:hypothetical protein